MTYSTQDAIRTVGQLILHRPAVKAPAFDTKGREVWPTKPEASTFCIHGACLAVGNKLGFNGFALSETVSDWLDHSDMMGNWWDRLTVTERRDVALRLCEYTA